MQTLQEMRSQELRAKEYTFKQNLYYWFSVIYWYVILTLEVWGLKSPFNSKFVEEETIPNELRNDKDIQIILAKRRMYVFKIHFFAGQRYGKDKVYFYHLDMVASNSANYYYRVYKNTDILKFISIYTAALGHDLIEDVRLTYNDVKANFGVYVTDIIYACTELRGRYRSERHGKAYYKTLDKSFDGKYVKLNDIKSNMYEGYTNGGTMFAKYVKEFPKVKEKLYSEEFEPITQDIELMINFPK